MTDRPPTAEELRRRLADVLEDSGDLRTAVWREAVEAVPREVFVREWFERVDTAQGTQWIPITGSDAALEKIYADTTLVTQLDGTVRPSDADGPMFGAPSSSSTLPGLVVAMLEDLQVEAGNDVLEIGTGTGYSTALLNRRLGGDKVMSVEVDADTAHRAAAALKEAGCRPHLVVGDGLDGVSARGAFDRIVATCSVRAIPEPWLAQARPGAVVLVNLTGWLHGFAQVRLTVRGPDDAVGEFLPGAVSFMTARRHAAPVVDHRPALAARGEGRPTRLGPDILQDWTARFVVQGALPRAVHFTAAVGNGPVLDHVVSADGSYATLLPLGDGTWRVREGGPRRLWESAERAVALWRSAGAPGAEGFRLRVGSGDQTVHLPGTDLRWALPSA